MLCRWNMQRGQLDEGAISYGQRLIHVVGAVVKEHPEKWVEGRGIEVKSKFPQPFQASDTSQSWEQHVWLDRRLPIQSLAFIAGVLSSLLCGDTLTGDGGKKAVYVVYSILHSTVHTHTVYGTFSRYR